MGSQDRGQSKDAETTETAYPLAHQLVGGGCPLGGGPFSDGATFEVTTLTNELTCQAAATTALAVGLAAAALAPMPVRFVWFI